MGTFVPVTAVQEGISITLERYPLTSSCVYRTHIASVYMFGSIYMFTRSINNLWTLHWKLHYSRHRVLLPPHPGTSCWTWSYQKGSGSGSKVDHSHHPPLGSTHWKGSLPHRPWSHLSTTSDRFNQSSAVSSPNQSLQDSLPIMAKCCQMAENHWGFNPSLLYSRWKKNWDVEIL